ncbi:MAG: hypothetical protein WB780_18890 [Candidatus Acidiferrales bacterium]
MRDSKGDEDRNASLKKDSDQRRLDFDSNLIGIVNTELDLANTFVRIAKSGGEEKTLRNRKNARKSYDAVLYYLDKTTLTQEEKTQIEDQLATLKSDLQSLGETF